MVSGAGVETPRGVFTIGPERPFVDDLAAGLLARTDADRDRLGLARTLVLLPTRRACRALREAFLRLGDGRPALLPRMVPLGDVDEDELAFAPDAGGALAAGLDLPPAIPEMRRRLLLARMVMQREGGRLPVDQAARLADELARLLDQVQTERLGFERLAELVPADYAAHWQETLRFLSIVTEAWPAILEAEGAIDPADRRNRLLAARAASWRQYPPATPVIAAGSTGSIPATADLLAVVKDLPTGAVVLPGLDRHLDEPAWRALEPSHPQFGLRELLRHLEVARTDVADWPYRTGAETAAPARVRLSAEAMRPAGAAEAWADAGQLPSDALDRVARIDAVDPHEEAGAIAVVLREAVETPGRTAALVTPDRALARRVAAALERWDLVVDDSAGIPLAETPPGTFLRLCARMAHERMAPVATLAALKHPLAAGGQAPGRFRHSVRMLEVHVLRGPRPRAGVAGIRAAARWYADEAVRRDRDAYWLAGCENLLDSLDDVVTPFADLLSGAGAASVPELVHAHVRMVEALAADETRRGAERLWRGEAGEALAEFVAALGEYGDALGPVPGQRYVALLDALLAGRAVRPRYGAHPRLAILGPLEARLQRFDVTVLGGLNEGTWPPDPGADPWMGRPMRADFGLPAPERRIGLGAHDFAQAFCAPTLVLSRAERVDGAPTIPSRWLSRLEIAARAFGLDSDAGMRIRGRTYLDWWRSVDGAAARDGARIDPATIRPQPRPPVEVRPRRLSVTQIETWMRDPYAVYARHILALHALRELDEAPDAAEYGSRIHAALDAFLGDCSQGPLPPDAHERLIARGAEILAPFRNLPAVWTFWWPRFERIAAWFVEAERARRSGVECIHTEVAGCLQIDAPHAPFHLIARADRIDRLVTGGYAVIDFKTGAPPSKKEVEAGFAPQLPLEAAMVQQGAFAGIPSGGVEELAFWRLSGGREPGRVHPAGDDPHALGRSALEGLRHLIRAFDDPATPYESRPRADRAPRYSDYEHLARIREWSAGGERGDSGEGGS